MNAKLFHKESSSHLPCHERLSRSQVLGIKPEVHGATKVPLKTAGKNSQTEFCRGLAGAHFGMGSKCKPCTAGAGINRRGWDWGRVLGFCGSQGGLAQNSKSGPSLLKKAGRGLRGLSLEVPEPWWSPLTRSFDRTCLLWDVSLPFLMLAGGPASPFLPPSWVEWACHGRVQQEYPVWVAQVLPLLSS